MLQVKLQGDKEVLGFVKRYPKVFEQSIKETTGFAVNKITRSTAKGKGTGTAHSGWRTKKRSIFSWLIYNIFFHATFLEYGTGLFGPYKRKIVPISKKVLAWPDIQGNTKKGMIFAASSKGMKAQPAIKPNIRIIEKDLTARFKKKIKILWSKTR